MSRDGALRPVIPAIIREGSYFTVLECSPFEPEPSMKRPIWRRTQVPSFVRAAELADRIKQKMA